MSTFMGLEIGKSAIMANQTALNVTGHNIANANTPGYTRQIANLVTTRPWHTPMMTGSASVGQLGTGVDVADITRIRDGFIDDQIRNENRTSGYWNTQQESFDTIEVILNEPSDNGLRSVMDNFWQSWQDLSANPESEAVRSVVAQRGMAVTDTFNHTFSQLTDLRQAANTDVKIKVDEINSNALQIKDLNQQILAISIAGQQPNDLLDKRDLLLDKLSQLVDINIHDDGNGMVAVQIGGRTLVQGNQCTLLDTQADKQGMYMVSWKDTGTKAEISGGELRGLLDSRGKTELSQENIPSDYKEIIPNLIEKLNTLAKTLVVKTNELHKQGYSLNNKGTLPDGTDFFVMPPEPSDSIINWAEIMKVNASITDDPGNIAAAATPTWDASGNKVNFGDGTQALSLAQLKQNLNSDNAQVQTGNIEVSPAKPVTAISMQVMIDGKIKKVDITPTSYTTMTDLAVGIQGNLDTLNLGVEVKASDDGNSLVFSSADNRFQGIMGLKMDYGVNPSVDYGNFSVLAIKGVTSDDYWRSMAADVGVQSQESQRMVDNQTVLVNQLENKRQSLSGVSLDEEMTNMIKYQQAYNAAARYITTMDEQMDTILSRMGLVGR